MITMTLGENNRSLQPRAEAGNLTDIALGQVLRLLFDLLPRRNRLFIALISPTQFPAYVANPAGRKELRLKNFPANEGGGERQDQLITSREKHH